MLLEVIACSVADAIAAEQGGATRLELIADFERDGLTPTIDLVDDVLRAVHIPVRVMLRARHDFDAGSPAELDRLCSVAESLAARPLDGLVLGFIRDAGVDEGALNRILAAGAGLRATFHRAIEATSDPVNALQALKRFHPIDWVLTSGGHGPWAARSGHLRALQRAAWPQVHILAGGGIDEHAIVAVCASTSIRAFHLGRAVREPATTHGQVVAGRVAHMRRCIERCIERAH
jgi:copper homeostasis protein